MTMMHKNRSVNPHQFSMIPRADIPRASFDREFTHKTTFDAVGSFRCMLMRFYRVIRLICV
jgi:hypothetical protein